MNTPAEWFIKVIFFALSLVMGIQDYKHRSISAYLCAAGILLGIVNCILHSRALLDIGKALIPGVLFSAVSLLTSGCIGLGDVLFTFTCGLFMEWQEILWIVVITWMVCSIISLIMVFENILFKKNIHKVGIPFVTIMVIIMMAVNMEEGRWWINGIW